MNFVLFFWVLLWHFLPPNPSCDNYCGVCGELSSWNSKQSADLTKSLRETKTKLNQTKKNELLIWAKALQQHLSNIIKMHYCPDILAQCKGFSPKIMQIPIY